jgi:hypothetical protein
MLRAPARSLGDYAAFFIVLSFIKGHIFFAESDCPLSGVIETPSQSLDDDDDSSSDDDEPAVISKVFILNGKEDKKKNQKFRLVKAAPWMKNITPLEETTGYITCVLVTDGLPVLKGTSWRLPLNGQRNYVTWKGSVLL